MGCWYKRIAPFGRRGRRFDVAQFGTGDDAQQNRGSVTLLDRAMFRNRHWLATYFSRRITRPRGWCFAWLVGAVAWFQNKLRPFVVHSKIRAIVTHPAPALDCRRIMDEGRVLIASLSKGRLGEDNATLLGALLVTSIQQAAMTRADIPESQRRDFYLYVDEFQNFTTGSFASILSEARKYRLSLIVAHQYLSQLTDETADAVFGNVGSIVAFQVGNDDAQRLAEQLGKYPGQMTPENLTGLPKYTAYARLLVDGMPSSPFSMQTLPPPQEIDPERAAIIRGVMARRFGQGATSDRASGITVAA